MDYEKRYNEALERFKAFKEKYYTKNTVIGDAIFDKTGEMQKDFDSIFPELAESEDERIRKEIVNIINHLGEGIIPIPENQEELLSWLEKQKINTEGDFARGYDCGYECCLNSHGAEWLEKQKECVADSSKTQADEDEKIRENIIGYIQERIDDFPDDFTLVKQWRREIAWLEEQKDKKQNATEKLSEVLKDFAEKCRRVLKAKGIDTIFSDEFFKSCAVCYSKQEAVEFQKWYKDLMLSEEKQKEQKPNIEICPHSIKSKSYKEQKPVDEAENFFDSAESYHQGFIAGQKKMKDDIEKGFGISEHSFDYLAGRYAGYTAAKQEQKPAWSEEDNIGWDEAFACVTRSEKDAKNEEELQNAVTAEKWLKEIKFKYCVHPVKPEWSEEDEKMLNLAIEWAETMSGQFSFVDMDSTDFRKIINWLKSLRPPKDCSGCSKHLEGYISGRGDAENKLLEMYGILLMPDGELRMKPRWKPSEEQMNCLCAAVDAAIRKHNESVSGYEPARVLKSLYEHLQKL